MSDEQDNNLNNRPVPSTDPCEKCGKNPCICTDRVTGLPNEQQPVVTPEETVAIPQDPQQEKDTQGEKQPPKVRWI